MTTDKMTQYLEQMAVQLGIAAEHVYGVLIAQAYAQGVRDTIMGGSVTLIMFVAIVSGLVLLWKAYEAKGRDLDELMWKHTGAVVWSFVAIVFSGVILIIFATMLSDGILMILNPEYYAIREIMNVIGGDTR